MQRKKKEPRCKIGTDLNKSFQLKVLQHGAGQDMRHIQCGLRSQRYQTCNKCQHLLVVPVPVIAEQDSPFSHFSEGRGQSSEYFITTLSPFHMVWKSGALVQGSKRSLRVFPSTYHFRYTAYQTSQKQKELPAPEFPKILLECNLRRRGDWVPSYLSFLTWLERSTEKARIIKEHGTYM